MPSLFSALRPEAPSSVTNQDLVNAQAEVQSRLWRFWFLAVIFVFLTCLVLVRLVVYQVVQTGEVIDPDLRALTVPARGSIVDRDGELLAGDQFFYQVVATPNQIKDDRQRQLVAQRLQDLIGLPALTTWQILNENKERTYVELAKAIDLSLGQQLQKAIGQELADDSTSPLQYIAARPIPVRFYPQDNLVSHLIGFVQADHEGVYGLEEYYDAFLKANGVGLLERTPITIDSLPVNVRRFLPSATGKDLMLTIDRSIQWIIEEELVQGIAKYRAKRGTIIVIEPQTGAILGLANWPDYDPNRRDGEQVDFTRFTDPAVSSIYEPGSVFKFVTMAAGLDTGVITPTSVFTDDGYIVVGERTIFNSTRTGSGQVNVTQALARSLNVVTAQVAERVGAEDFYRYVRRFGFAEQTGVDLADEVPGLLKTPGHELWSLSDLGTNSFGQGLAVTPLQMANATAAVANHGLLMRPYVVQARIEHEEVLYTKPTALRQVISPHSAAELTEMMVETVDSGNKAAAVAGYRIAGKSGTAQIPDEGGYLKDATIVSFVGFAPADDPKFAILVKLDEPDPALSQWAAYTAAPIFAQIARRLFEHLNIPPDEIRTQLAANPGAAAGSQ
ncbi:MAG: penicillin-binding protein 2 [Caldilineaceae bacterium]